MAERAEAEKITWEGSIYGSHKADLAFDHEFQTSDGGFHSGGNDLGKALTVDYGRAYKLDKLEYYPRTDAGNGTVTKMRIETSLDRCPLDEPGGRLGALRRLQNGDVRRRRGRTLRAYDAARFGW